MALARQPDGVWAFAAPPARITPLAPDLHDTLRRVLGTATVDFDAIPCAVDNGAPWLVVRVASVEACLALAPDAKALATLVHATGTHGLAVYAAHAADGPATFELRCLMAGGDFGVGEDPVTGSANAALACLLDIQGRRPGTVYTVRQGTVLGRDGRVAVRYAATGTPWIGGDCVSVVEGTFRLP